MNSPAVKYVLGPLRRLLQNLSEKDMLLVLSLFVGVIDLDLHALLGGDLH